MSGHRFTIVKSSACIWNGTAFRRFLFSSLGPHNPRIVTFALEGITDLNLDGEDINKQNVISSLEIEKTKNGTRLTFWPCYGLCGRITADRVRVRLEPN